MDKLIGWIFLIVGLFFTMSALGAPWFGKMGEWGMAIGFILIGLIKLTKR